MCRTAEALVQTCVCGAQMIVRIVMIVLMMVENLLKLFLQSFYNICSIVLQIISILPVCLVFVLTSKLKCLICGGGGGGGGCNAAQRTAGSDCVMTLLVLIILYYVMKANGMLDNLFTNLGYSKTKTN